MTPATNKNPEKRPKRGRPALTAQQKAHNKLVRTFEKQRLEAEKQRRAVADLFGQIPVYTWEIEVWQYLVPRLPHYMRWRTSGSYARDWNVADKIRAAKQDGRYKDIFSDCSCEFCGRDLRPADAPQEPLNPAAELEALRRRVAVLETVIAAQAAVSAQQGMIPASTTQGEP